MPRMKTLLALISFSSLPLRDNSDNFVVPCYKFHKSSYNITLSLSLTFPFPFEAAADISSGGAAHGVLELRQTT